MRGEKNISILFNNTSRQIRPECSSHKHRGCKHFHFYKQKIEEQVRAENPGLLEYDYGHFWDRKARDQVTVPKPAEHYDDDTHHFRQHGFNKTRFDFPLRRDPALQKKIAERNENFESAVIARFGLSDQLIPTYNPDLKCPHNNLFDASNEKLKKMSEKVTVFTERNEYQMECKVYGRPTNGDCNCFVQADCHELALWHLGDGKLIDYNYLLAAILGFFKGHSFTSQSETRKEIIEMAAGVESAMTFKDLHRASTGFAKMMKLKREDFICPNCGETPAYIVCDGKQLGPRSVHTKHLSELGPAEGDEDILEQSTKFKDRCFLIKKKERNLLKGLVTGEKNFQDFAAYQMQTGNGRLVKALVSRLSRDDNDKFEHYKDLLENISKMTPVCGFLQVNKKDTLPFLKAFCRRTLDLRNNAHNEKLSQIQTELPALWPALEKILSIERTNFLPEDVNKIMLKLIEIREKTFSQAADRTDVDYFPYTEGKEPATQFYPVWQTRVYPKRYDVNNKADKAQCEKNYKNSKKYSNGVFSIGCSCRLNITYGFELMIGHESPENPFRVLTTRDINLKNLEGVIYDHACGLQKYALNREAQKFEFTRFLVDGSHVNAHKKLKKSTFTQGGHPGCSWGYDFNRVTKHLNFPANSQGREQIHKLIEPMASSLRYMRYDNYMNIMKAFFGYTNLKKLKKL